LVTDFETTSIIFFSLEAAAAFALAFSLALISAGYAFFRNSASSASSFY